MSDTKQPYQTLGKHLRYLREQQAQSLAEVSGAVEIDQKDLERIEAGQERPPEDILMLLISHFNMQDQEAVQLWEMAGYDGSSDARQKQEDVLQDIMSGIGGQKPVVLVVGMDNRTLYTDASHVTGDPAGITITFGKRTQQTKSQPLASFGMSYEQAHEVVAQLQKALLYGKHNTSPKQLPPITENKQ
jgi:hypothetical protein